MAPTATEYRKLDSETIWHPFTKLSAAAETPFPVIMRGDGPFLYDADDNRYVDAISSWWCSNLGHSHPRMVEALKEQAEVLQHSILGNLTHPKAIELATKLLGHFPSRQRRVLFASDGACAVEAAMRQAVQYWHNIGKPGKHKFVALKEGYHGDTLGSMSLGYMPSFHQPYKDIVMPVYHADTPFCAGCPVGKRPDTCDTECFSDMRKIIEGHGDELAAAVVEPHCQGAAGMRMYKPDYLKKLAALCRRHDVLLIVDEIAMGFGRTGKMFSFEHAGIDPDIVCLGKGLSGGYLPVSAAVTKEHIYRTFTDKPVDHTFYHGHTFAGNPLGMAAASACLDIYEEEPIVERSASLAEVVAEEFEKFKDLEGVEKVRSFGMIGAVNVQKGRDGQPGTERAQSVRRELLSQGILLRPLGNVLYLMLPLISSEELVRDTAHKLYDAIANLSG